MTLGVSNPIWLASAENISLSSDPNEEIDDEELDKVTGGAGALKDQTAQLPTGDRVLVDKTERKSPKSLFGVR